MARKKPLNNEIENPKPRIGRGLYTRGEKVFKPSKRLQKQYRKVKEKYKRATEEYDKRERRKHGTPFPQDTIDRLRDEYGDDTPLTIEEAFERGIVGSKVKKRPVLTSIVDKATILSSQYGIDGAAELLGVDEDFLDHALRGNRLDRRDTAILQRGYDNLIIDNQDIDFDSVEKFAEKLQQSIIFVNEERYHGDDLKNTFRYEVAEQKVDITELENIDSLFLSNRMSPAVKAKVIEWLSEEDHTADVFIEAWKLDLENSDGFVDDIQASYWWAWFRETFYS